MPKPGFSLYFNHIPKTGGTSLRFWLFSFFDESEIEPELLYKPGRPIQIKRSGIQLISGHHADSIGDTAYPGYRKIVWFREPQSWIGSTYRYLVRNPSYIQTLAPGLEMPEGSFSFSDFVRDYSRKGMPVHGYQARFLSAREIPLPPETLSCNERLGAALEKLDGYLLAGSLSHMQESVDLLCHRLQWPPSNFVNKFNTTSEDPFEPSQDDYDAFAMENPDFELFRIVDQRVCEDFAAMAVALGCPGAEAGSKELHAVMAVNFCRNGNPAFHARCRENGEAMFGNGWGPPFAWGEHQPRSIRWAGSERTSHVFIPVMGSTEHEIEFDLLISICQPTHDNLRIKLGQTVLEHTLTPIPEKDFPGAVRLQLVIPASMVPRRDRFMPLILETSPEAYAACKPDGADPVHTIATDRIRVSCRRKKFFFF